MSKMEKFGVFIKYLIYGEGVNPLSTKIVGSLIVVLLFNSMTITMAFVFIPQLVKSFGNSEVDAGYKVGILGGALFLGRILSSFLWGWAADTYGRRRFAILAAVFLATSTLAFGFTFNYTWALFTRFCQGLSMGLIVIAKAIIGECSDNTNQSLAMSFLSGSYSVGLIAGPSIGGFLAFPHEQYPNSFPPSSIFTKFEVLLPCLLVSSGLFFGCILIWFTLPKFKRRTKQEEKVPSINYDNKTLTEETRLIDVENNIGKYKIKMVIYDDSFIEPAKSSRRKRSVVGIIFRSKLCMMTCILNGFDSFITIGYDEVFPLYTATSEEFKGYGFKTFEIGIALVIIAGLAVIIQFTVLSRIIQKLGLIGSIKYFRLVQAFAFPLVPLCYYIENRNLFWFLTILVAGIIRITSLINFVCINIMVNNSIEQKYLASVNGISMTIATLARLISVPVFGALYSWSLTNIKSVKENTKPLGFPFNQYFVFFFFSIGSILIIFYVCMMPRSLERQYEEDT